MTFSGTGLDYLLENLKALKPHQGASPGKPRALKHLLATLSYIPTMIPIGQAVTRKILWTCIRMSPEATFAVAFNTVLQFSQWDRCPVGDTRPQGGCLSEWEKIRV